MHPTKAPISKRVAVLRSLKQISVFSLIIIASLHPQKTTSALINFNNGTHQSTKVTSKNTLTLSPSLAPYLTLDVDIIWCVEPYKNSLYIGTGHESKLFQIQNKTLEKELKLPEGELLSLSVGAKKIYAGAAPKGILYAVEPDLSKFKVLSILPEQYLWDIYNDEGTLYVAVGAPAKIYRVNSTTGESEVFFQSKENNVLKVVKKNKHFYASTSPSGLLYKISETGEHRVLYDARGKDINDFVVTENEIYLSTSGKKIIELPAQQNSQKPPQSWFENEVVKVTDNSSETLAKFRNQSLPSITLVNENTLYVGTGNTGVIFSIDITTKRVEKLHDIDFRSFSSFISFSTNLLVVSPTTGEIFDLNTKVEETKGRYVSEIIDASSTTLWGNIEYLKYSTKDIELQVRGGNTGEVSDDWSEWVSVTNMRVPGNMRSRYLQIALLFISDKNQVPEISDLKVYYSLPNESASFESVHFGRDEFYEKQKKLNLSENEELLRWRVLNPDKDRLIYSLYFKNQYYKEFLVIASNHQEDYYVFSKSSLIDGVYEFKVSLTDEGVNPKSSAMVDEILSKKYIVDTTPPELKNFIQKVNGNLRTISFTISDEYSVIAKVFYSVEHNEYNALTPTDNLSDSKTEHYSFSIPSEKKHIILYYSDSFNNQKHTAILLNN